MSVQTFDLSDWNVIEITGQDRQSFLHSFSTNDIKKLQPGQGCEAFIPNIKGRILGHVLIFAEQERLQLVTVPGASEVLVPHLTKYLLGIDAQVTDHTDQTSLMCISGTNATALIEGHFRVTAPQGMHDHIELTTPTGTVLLARSCLTSLDNFLIIGAQEMLAGLQPQLLDLGCEIGPLSSFQALRIAAGFPWHGVDISEETIAQEAARTAQAISFTKGCYLGQEPIARLDAMGHTNKELRGLEISGEDLPGAGAEVYSGEKLAGVITSIMPISDNAAVALAMIKTKYGAAGNRLSLTHSNSGAEAVIVWPPTTA